MRLYSFVNGNYLSGGQHGLQTGHAAVHIARMAHNKMAVEWADKHETFIILNAHNYAGLLRITNELSDLITMYNALLRDKSLSLPYTTFFEDFDSLGGIQTCFACVLPEEFYTEIPLLNRDEAKQLVEEYWNGVNNFHCMSHTTQKYRDLIINTIKAYNLVQL
jgi:hypothetical protein